MALGNSNSSSKSRGKNKPVIVKRRKEVVMAKNFHALTSSGSFGSGNACKYSGSLAKTFYHNGSDPLPGKNDVVYSTKRANPKSVLEAGNYKISVALAGKKPFVGVMNINAIGVVASVERCK